MIIGNRFFCKVYLWDESPFLISCQIRCPPIKNVIMTIVSGKPARLVFVCLLAFKSMSAFSRRGAQAQPNRRCRRRQSLAGAVGPGGGMRWKWNARVVLAPAPAPRGRSTRHAPASSANLVVRVVVMISLHKYWRKLWAAKATLNTSSPDRVFSAASPVITAVLMSYDCILALWWLWKWIWKV